MASIRKRGSTYQVRWRDLEGIERGQRCPDLQTARRVRLEVEQALAVGKDWRPRDRADPPSLSEVFQQYLTEIARRVKDTTAEQYRIALRLFLVHLRQEKPQGTLQPALLKDEVLGTFFDSLLSTNNRSSAADAVRHVQRAWRWAYRKNRRFGGSVPPPEEIELPQREILLRPWAPSWSMADEVIWAAWSAKQAKWYGDFLALLRYTGLRKSQIMKLRWSDLDLTNCQLYIRPELGKSKQEARGRTIPVTPHLVELVSGWDRHSDYLVATDKPQRRIDNITLRKRWEAAGIEPEDLRQPTHSFRKMIVSELRKARADPMAVKALVGHQLDMTADVYTTFEAMMPLMEEAVGHIPKIGAGDSNLVPLRGHLVDTRSNAGG
ncbi:MAG: tyrosine-type recombinase/integrase [Bradymonadia bacterium]